MANKKIPSQAYKTWSVREDKWLIEHGPKMLRAADLERYTGRSIKGIKKRAKKLGVHLKIFREWPQKDIDLLRERYPTTTAKELAKILGKSVSAIHSAAAKYGIKKNGTKKQALVNENITPGAVYETLPLNQNPFGMLQF